MVELKLTFDTRTEVREYLEGQEVRYGVSEWLREVRNTLKHGDLSGEQQEFLEVWHNKLLDHIKEYTQLDIL